MKNKIYKKMALLLTVFAALFLLGACSKLGGKKEAAEATEVTEDKDEPDLTKEDEKTPNKKSGHDRSLSGKTKDNAAKTKEMSAEGAASLAELHKMIDNDPVMFGVAYLGNVGGLFDEGFEKGFPKWLEENNAELLEKYPFIREIDEDHIVGSVGNLYVIVPVDENATIAANRIKWNTDTWEIEDVSDVIYRSESGEPILLFANLGMDPDADFDTQVNITDNRGNTCTWYPGLGDEDTVIPCIPEDGNCYSWDFTEYGPSYVPLELKTWMVDGWCGPTALGLAGSDEWGMTWSITTTAWETDKRGHFVLTFYPGDENGGAVDLDWCYEGETEYEEQWSGFWTIQTSIEKPSLVTIDLSRVGGNSYGTADGPNYISETYSVLISQRGEDLIIAKGENNICLPFMTESTILSRLTLAYG